MFAATLALLLIAGIRNAWDMIVFLVTRPRSPSKQGPILLRSRGYQTICTPYAAKARSLVAIGMPSASACAIIIRSNGSR